MSRVMEEKFNPKLRARGSNPPQVFWCRDELSGIEDLQGRKIRVFNTTMVDFLDAVGATTLPSTDAVAPTSPTLLSAASGGNGSCPEELWLRWTAASDDREPPSGIEYEVRVNGLIQRGGAGRHPDQEPQPPGAQFVVTVWALPSALNPPTAIWPWATA